MLLEEGAKTQGRWRKALCVAGVAQQHREDTALYPGITWNVLRDTGWVAMWGHRSPLPSLIPGMCQRCTEQLRALPHMPGDRCGVTCWNLLLLGGIWAEESWHRAGGARREDVLWWEHRCEIQTQSVWVTVGNQVPVQVGNKLLTARQD